MKRNPSAIILQIVTHSQLNRRITAELVFLTKLCLRLLNVHVVLKYLACKCWNGSSQFNFSSVLVDIKSKYMQVLVLFLFKLNIYEVNFVRPVGIERKLDFCVHRHQSYELSRKFGGKLWPNAIIKKIISCQRALAKKLFNVSRFPLIYTF